MTSSRSSESQSSSVVGGGGGGGGEEFKLEISIPLQQIRAKQKGGGGLINKGGVISSEYGTSVGCGDVYSGW